MPRPAERALSFIVAALICSAIGGCRALPKSGSQPSVFQSSVDSMPPSILEPSNNRDWLPDMAVLPFAEIDGEKVKLHNIRNCEYRADDEFVVKHYDKTFDLRKIKSVDFIVAPFKQAEGLAHTMMSFGFDGDEYVCVSVEARLEKGEKYSPVLGAMRQYELMYVLADERDVILRRTRYRDNDVYLYRTIATPEQSRALFLDVVARVNKLYRAPEFYDTITNNCTTNLVQHVNHVRPSRIPLWDMRVVLPGYADQLAYELSLLDLSKSFEQLREEARITERANEVARRGDFSERIRR